MKGETDFEFWNRICATPAGRKACQETMRNAHVTALALKTVVARQAQPATSTAPARGELFGLDRTIAAMKAKAPAVRPLTESIWAKQFQAKELTGLARTIAAFKRAA